MRAELQGRTATGDAVAGDGDAAGAGGPRVEVVAVVDGDWLAVAFDLTNLPAGTSPSFHPCHRETLALLREHELWRSTCYECFIATPGGPYVEVNLTPDGRFNVYSFDAYREPASTPPRELIGSSFDVGRHLNLQRWSPDLQPVWWVSPRAEQRAVAARLREQQPTGADHRLVLLVSIAALRAVGALDRDSDVLVNPTLVLDPSNSAGGALSYWAADHVDPPDFHDASGWLVV